MSFDVEVHDHPAAFLTERLEQRAREAIGARGRFVIALPGGSVATTCFPRFAEAVIDWSRVHFFWGDERAVPATHPDSNYGLAEKLWLERIVAHAPVVHRMEADHADLDEAAARYERALRENGPLDVALLGVGPDGHVCSLFPGDALLSEKTRLVAPLTSSPKPPPRRLTLTLPALAMAREVIVVAMGEAKAPIVRALREHGSSLPAALALRGAAKGTLVLDRAAAG